MVKKWIEIGSFFCGNIENTLLCNITLGLDQAQPHQCHTQLQRDTEACEENQRGPHKSTRQVVE